jgi:signal recognition particle GTPase
MVHTCHHKLLGGLDGSYKTAEAKKLARLPPQWKNAGVVMWSCIPAPVGSINRLALAKSKTLSPK